MSIRRLKRISESDRELLIVELKKFLNAQEEIVFALLYGSMVTPEVPEKYGDIDLAIYVKPEHLKEPEHILETKTEAELLRHLSFRALNFPPIEVLIINKAPYSFSTKLLKGKYIILKENEEALTDFIDEVGRKSMINLHLRSESLRELLGA
jgi:predicted nucleotidyltransferase